MNNQIKNKIINPLKKLFSRSSLFYIGLLLIAVFIHARHMINSDEGIILNGAWNLINGKIPYTDFFTFVTPGSYYIIYWLWKIFGVSFWAARIFAIFIMYFSAIGIYKISKLVIDNKYTKLPPFIFMLSSMGWPIINLNTFNIFFIIWGVFYFLKGIKNGNNKDIIKSGILSGISFLFLQQKGLALIFAAFSFLLALYIFKKNKEIIKSSFYYLFFSILSCLILLIKWPIKILYNNLIVFPSQNYIGVNRMPLDLFILFLLILFLLVYIFRKNKEKIIWALLYLQFFLLLSAYPRPDSHHIFLSIFPLYALLPLIIRNVGKMPSLILRIYYKAVIFSLILLIIYPITNIFVYKFSYYNLIEPIKELCQGSDYIYAGPFMPNIYFETRKLNPTPYYALLTDMHSNSMFLEVKDDLEKYKPSCAVLNYNMVKKFNYNTDNPVDNYIMTNYEFEYEDGDLLLYKRKN